MFNKFVATGIFSLKLHGMDILLTRERPEAKLKYQYSYLSAAADQEKLTHKAELADEDLFPIQVSVNL